MFQDQQTTRSKPWILFWWLWDEPKPKDDWRISWMTTWTTPKILSTSQTINQTDTSYPISPLQRRHEMAPTRSALSDAVPSFHRTLERPHITTESLSKRRTRRARKTVERPPRVWRLCWSPVCQLPSLLISKPSWKSSMRVPWAEFGFNFAKGVLWLSTTDSSSGSFLAAFLSAVSHWFVPIKLPFVLDFLSRVNLNKPKWCMWPA